MQRSLMGTSFRNFVHQLGCLSANASFFRNYLHSVLIEPAPIQRDYFGLARQPA
jgi:hypothetical protein